uniref:SRCR domain-containing protein n=1 Tax=Oncorhynchus tshawytscha TaxID=74940 RepID=A0AAZ3R000_ONCTS
MNDAKVVCKQLGCGSAMSSPGSAYFGQGTGEIWMDDIKCSGSESTLRQCSHTTKHNCNHGEDAGVVCLSVKHNIRLVNGSDLCSGRVEVYQIGHWQTVCNDIWDLNDSAVACRQLGCGRAVSAPERAYFGQGSGPIWQDDVGCSGSECSITQCPHTGGTHDCHHGNDAGVICSGKGIRLVNGKDRCSGRVEIYYSGQWGTVCDDSWDIKDAEVVCRQLDCGVTNQVRSSGQYGPGSGTIWLDDVACTGSERHLTECPHRGFGIHNCHHSEDAGVVCPAAEVRLVDGKGRCSGRVEIYHSGQWGTVCDDDWDMNDAAVVCGQLGCGSAVGAPLGAHFGQGSEPTWLDNVNCSGSESYLSECSHRSFGVEDCNHGEDAGVFCLSAGEEIRLVNGTSHCCGVEILYKGQWGRVCGQKWDVNNANVVCGQLGCGRAVSAQSSVHLGQGSGGRPTWLDDVGCKGSESSLTEFVCSGKIFHSLLNFLLSFLVKPNRRLVNGSDLCSGRLEVYQTGYWRTVCNDVWDLNDAPVVCRQLGCGRADIAPERTYFGQGSGPIWQDDVGCSGSVCSITQCPHTGGGTHDCNHSNDAGVICSGNHSILEASSIWTSLGPTRLKLITSQIRLVNGKDRCSGRVEIYYSGQWGTVCDDSWDIKDAEVVCRQLDCGVTNQVRSSGQYGPGSGTIWLDDVACTGSERHLTECPHRGFGIHNCHHSEDAGVVSAEVRLVDGKGRCSGRVEIYHSGQWGTVCDDDWDMNDAAVVCGQLGCGSAVGAPLGAHFGQGSEPTWLDNVNCSGSESYLSECSHRSFGVEDLTDETWSSCSFLTKIRLVNGTSHCCGVEILYKAQWGRVCGQKWDVNNANVVCGQLGCGRAVSAQKRTYFGQGSGPIWQDDVGCSGSVCSITQCPHTGGGTHDCNHSNDAGVICSGNCIRIWFELCI